MMNSHIAIFFAGTENAGSAVRPAVGPPIVKSAWLTGASLLLLELAKASSTATTADIPKARAGHALPSARRRKSCWDSWPGKVLGNAIAARRGTGRTRKTIQGTA